MDKNKIRDLSKRWDESRRQTNLTHKIEKEEI